MTGTKWPRPNFKTFLIFRRILMVFSREFHVKNVVYPHTFFRIVYRFYDKGSKGLLPWLHIIFISYPILMGFFSLDSS